MTFSDPLFWYFMMLAACWGFAMHGLVRALTDGRGKKYAEFVSPNAYQTYCPECGNSMWSPQKQPLECDNPQCSMRGRKFRKPTIWLEEEASS